MSLIIDLAPDVEQWLRDEAERRGLNVNVYARQLIERCLLAEPERVVLGTPVSDFRRELQSWLEEDVGAPACPADAPQVQEEGIST